MTDGGTALIVRVWGVPELAASLRELGIACADDHPDVGVIAIERDADVEAIRQLDDVPLLALVPAERTDANARRVIELVELGVAAVLPLGTAPARIAELLRELAAADREAAVHPFVAELLVLGLRARGAVKNSFAITRRERQVLQLVVEGRTTADIATCLGIGFHTAQTHLKNLFRKLDVGSRAAATSIALKNQLV